MSDRAEITTPPTLTLVQDKTQEANAFLRGDWASLEEVRTVIENTVRCFRFTGSDLHRELVQESTARLYASLSAGRFRGQASLGTYAQNVAKYACLDYLRKRRTELKADPQSFPKAANEMGPEESLLQKEDVDRHLRLFASLPLGSQELLNLIFVQGLNYREVAERLGLSEAGVKSRVHRCRLILRGVDASHERRQDQ